VPRAGNAVPSSSATTLDNLVAADLEAETALRDSQSLEQYYQHAVRGDVDEEEGNGEDDDDDDDDDPPDDEHLDSTEHTGVNDAMAWVDKFVLTTRRNGGQQTETSVVKLYKVSICKLDVCFP
jgi:hypothetical protein